MTFPNDDEATFWRRGHGSPEGFPEPDDWELDRMADRYEAHHLGWRRDEL